MILFSVVFIVVHFVRCAQRSYNNLNIFTCLPTTQGWYFSTEPISIFRSIFYSYLKGKYFIILLYTYMCVYINAFHLLSSAGVQSITTTYILYSCLLFPIFESFYRDFSLFSVFETSKLKSMEQDNLREGMHKYFNELGKYFFLQKIAYIQYYVIFMSGRQRRTNSVAGEPCFVCWYTNLY